MVALRFLCLILLSGGLLMQPVLLQMVSCCCAEQEAGAALAVDSAPESAAPACPNCRAAQQAAAPAGTTTSLHSCSCSQQVDSTVVARLQSITDVELQLAAAECPLGSTIANIGSDFVRPQSHPPGRGIPARILKCSWLI